MLVERLVLFVHQSSHLKIMQMLNIEEIQINRILLSELL